MAINNSDLRVGMTARDGKCSRETEDPRTHDDYCRREFFRHDLVIGVRVEKVK